MTGSAALFGNQRTSAAEGRLPFKDGICRVMNERSCRNRFPRKITPCPEQPQGRLPLRRRSVLDQDRVLPTPQALGFAGRPDGRDQGFPINEQPRLARPLKVEDQATPFFEHQLTLPSGGERTGLEEGGGALSAGNMQGYRANAPGITAPVSRIQSQDQPPLARGINSGGSQEYETRPAQQKRRGHKMESVTSSILSRTKCSHRIFIIRPLIRSKRDLGGNRREPWTGQGWKRSRAPLVSRALPEKIVRPPDHCPSRPDMR